MNPSGRLPQQEEVIAGRSEYGIDAIVLAALQVVSVHAVLPSSHRWNAIRQRARVRGAQSTHRAQHVDERDALCPSRRVVQGN